MGSRAGKDHLFFFCGANRQGMAPGPAIQRANSLSSYCSYDIFLESTVVFEYVSLAELPDYGKGSSYLVW